MKDSKKKSNEQDQKSEVQDQNLNDSKENKEDKPTGNSWLRFKMKLSKRFGMMSPMKFVVMVSFVIFIAIEVYSIYKNSEKVYGDISVQEVYELVEAGEVESITVNRENLLLYVNCTDGSQYKCINPMNDTFIYDLTALGVDVQFQEQTLATSITTFVLEVPFLLLTIVFTAYLANQVMNSDTKTFTLLKNENNNTTFDDIKGLGETKKEVRFVVEQIMNGDRLHELGARPCKGILFYGPPGTGKTMLAKAIAKESGVNFISACGSDFVQMFVGLGAARVRALWSMAETNRPCIIFIDEIDTLGMKRSSRGGGGAETEYNQTLNALLQKMDGLSDNAGIFIIGATNRKDILDEAILRPGRFDRQYYVGVPKTTSDREEIAEVYLNKKKCTEDVTVEKAAKLMKGLSGAEIEQTLNEAVLLSLMRGGDGIISLRDIDEAAMETICGGVKDEHKTIEDKELVSIHESGHALVSLLLGDKVEKVSIIPYSSGVGGITQHTKENEEKQFQLKSEQIKDIKIALGGMIGEDVKYGEHSGGCASDLQKATEMVYSMLIQQGQDPRYLINENVLINNGVKHEVSSNIVQECNALLEQYREETFTLLNSNKDKLESLTTILMDKETIVDLTLEMLEPDTENSKETKASQEETVSEETIQ
jgi:cell division protease FtsH